MRRFINNSMYKRIIVIATPRTGSRFYCMNLADTFNLTNLDEAFSIDPILHPILHSHYPYTEYTPTQKRFLKLYSDELNALKMLKSQNNWVCKVFPHQVDRFFRLANLNLRLGRINKLFSTSDELYAALIQSCTNYTFLYRRDFRSQVISHAAGNVSGNWGGDRDITSISITDHQLISSRLHLISEYDRIKWLYEKYPGPVVALEDFSSHTGRYPEYQTITGNFDLIQDFDVEQEVFGIKRGGHCTPHPII